jgi:hypothetical protein
MRSRCILFMYVLYKIYSQGTITLASSSVVDLYIKLYMNYNFVPRIVDWWVHREWSANLHNLHDWTVANAHVTAHFSFGFSVGSQMIANHLGWIHYSDSSEQYFFFRWRCSTQYSWGCGFQHDGVSQHFSRQVRTLLNSHFPNTWTNRGAQLPRLHILVIIPHFLFSCRWIK